MTRKLIFGLLLSMLYILMPQKAEAAIKMDPVEYKALVDFFKKNKELFKKATLLTSVVTDAKIKSLEAEDPSSLSNLPSSLFLYTGFQFLLADDGYYRVHSYTARVLGSFLSDYQHGKVVYSTANSDKKKLEFPSNFFAKLPNIKVLDLSGTAIEEVPASITKAKLLESLKLNATFIEDLPSDIGDLENLNELAVQRTKLKNIPNSIGKLGKLERFDINNTDVASFPKEIFELKDLKDFRMGETKLDAEDVQNAIAGFTHLKHLEVGQNYRELCVVKLPKQKNGVTGDIIDPLPYKSELKQFDGANFDGNNNVRLAFNVEHDHVAKTTHLVVSDTKKYNEIQNNIALTVIQFSHPQGDFYKRYAWSNDINLNPGGIPSNLDKSKCPAPTSTFMPTTFQLTVDKPKIKASQFATPTITFPADVDPKVADELKRNIKYEIQGPAGVASLNILNQVEGLKQGKITLVAYSGKTKRQVEIEVGDSPVKPVFEALEIDPTNRQQVLRHAKKPHIIQGQKKKQIYFPFVRVAATKFIIPYEFEPDNGNRPDLAAKISHPKIVKASLPLGTKNLELHVNTLYKGGEVVEVVLENQGRPGYGDTILVHFYKLPSPLMVLDPAVQVETGNVLNFADAPVSYTLTMEDGVTSKYVTFLERHIRTNQTGVNPNLDNEPGSPSSGLGEHFTTTEMPDPYDNGMKFGVQKPGKIEIRHALEHFGDQTLSSQTISQYEFQKPFTKLENFSPGAIPKGVKTPFSYTFEPITATMSPVWEVYKNGKPSTDIEVLDTRSAKQLLGKVIGEYELRARIPFTKKYVKFTVHVVPDLESCEVTLPDLLFHGESDLNYTMITKPTGTVYPKPSFTFKTKVFNHLGTHMGYLKPGDTFVAGRKYQVEATYIDGKKCAVRTVSTVGKNSTRALEKLDKITLHDEYYSTESKIFVMNLDLGNKTEYYEQPTFNFASTKADGSNTTTDVDNSTYVKSLTNTERFQFNTNITNYKNDPSVLAVNGYTPFQDKGKGYLKIEFTGIEPSKHVVRVNTPSAGATPVAEATMYLEKTLERRKVDYHTTVTPYQIAEDKRDPATSLIYAKGESVFFKVTPDAAETASSYYKKRTTGIELTDPVGANVSLTETPANSKDYRAQLNELGDYTLNISTTNEIGTKKTQTKYLKVVQKGDIQFTVPKEAYSGQVLDAEFVYSSSFPLAYSETDYEVFPTANSSTPTQQEKIQGTATKKVTATTTTVAPVKMIHKYANKYFNGTDYNNNLKPDTTIVRPKMTDFTINFPNLVSFGKEAEITIEPQPAGAWLGSTKFVEITDDKGVFQAVRAVKTANGKFKLIMTFEGKFIMTFKDELTNIQKSHTFEVSLGVNSITVNDEKIKAGESIDLTYNITPLKATSARLNWEIVGNDYGCTLVGNRFTSTAAAAGKTIKVKAKTAISPVVESNEASIEVFVPVTSIGLSITNPAGTFHDRKYNKETDEFQFAANVQPANATDKSIDWVISEPAMRSIFQISSTGKLSYKNPSASRIFRQLHVEAHAKDGSGVIGSYYLKVASFPTSMRFTVSEIQIRGMEYRHQTTAKSGSYNIFVSPILDWINETAYKQNFTLNSNKVTPKNVGTFKLGRKILRGPIGNEPFKVEKDIKVYESVSSININGRQRIEVGTTDEMYTAILGPAGAKTDSVTWTVRPATGKALLGEATLTPVNTAPGTNPQTELSATKAGWVRLYAIKPLYHPKEPLVTTPYDIAILPSRAGVSGQLDLRILPNDGHADSRPDTIFIGSGTPDEFIYNTKGSLDPQFFNLEIKYHDRNNNVYNTDDTRKASGATQVAGATKQGFVSFHVVSSIDPTFVYMKDTLVIMPRPGRVSYDTVVVNQQYPFEIVVGENWDFGRGADNVAKSSGSYFSAIAMSPPLNLIPKTKLDFVLWRYTGSTLPATYDADEVTAVDSVHVVNGITAMSLSVSPAGMQLVNTNVNLTLSLTTDYKEDAFIWSFSPQPSSVSFSADRKIATITSSSARNITATVSATDGSGKTASQTVTFYKAASSVSVKDIVKPASGNAKDTLYVKDTKKYEIDVAPLDASNRDKAQWSITNNTGHLGFSPALSTEDISKTLTALKPTYSTPAVLTVRSKPAASEAAKSTIVEITVIQVVDSIQINMPDTVYISTTATTLRATPKLFPEAPKPLPSNTNVEWDNNGDANVVFSNTSASGDQTDITVSAAGRYDIKVRAKDRDKYERTKTLTVLKEVTSLTVGSAKDKVLILDKSPKLQMTATVNPDAQNPDIVWTLEQTDGTPISSAYAEIDKNGVLTVKSNNFKEIVVVATANNRPNSVKSVVGKKNIKIGQAVNSMTLSTSNLGKSFVYVGQTMDVNIVVGPAEADDKRVEWTLLGNDNNLAEYAKIQANPKKPGEIVATVKGLKPGFVTAKASTLDGSGIQRLEQIKVLVALERIYANIPRELTEGSTHQIVPSVGPPGAVAESYSYKLLYWNGTTLGEWLPIDPAVTIDQTGLLTMKASNKQENVPTLYVQITATDENNNTVNLINVSKYKTEADLASLGQGPIKYLNKVESLSIASPDEGILYVGQTANITADLKPTYADKDTVEWHPAQAATIRYTLKDKLSATIEATKAGNLTLYATSIDGTGIKSNELNFTVKQQMNDFKLKDPGIIFNGDIIVNEIEEIKPVAADDKRIVWSIEDDKGNPITDPQIASIDPQTGRMVVGPNAKGDIVIKASSQASGTGVTPVVKTRTVRVYQPITKIDVNGETRIPVGHTKNYTATLEPAKPSTEAVDWSITNSALVDLTNTTDLGASLVAKQPGFLELVAIGRDAKKEETRKIIEVYEPVTQISSYLSGLSQNLFLNQTKTIVAVTAPASANSSLVYRVIEGPSFISLNGNKVTGTKVGLAKVEIKADDVDEKKDTIEVKVIIPIKDMNVKVPRNIPVGGKAKIEVTVNPDATEKVFSFTPSNDKIFITQDGTIHAEAPGKVTITVLAQDGSLTTQTIDINIFEPVRAFQLSYSGVDRVFNSPLSMGPISGERFVAKDSVNITVKAFPLNATNRKFNIDYTYLPGSDKILTNEKTLANEDKTMEFYTEVPTRAAMVLTALDAGGFKDTIVFESTKWLENIKMSRTRKVVPIFGTEFIAPNIINGIGPDDASYKSIRYYISDDKLAEVDEYGNVTAFGKYGKFTVYAEALDGSGVRDSIEMNITKPSLSLRLKDNKKSLPVKFEEKVIVTTFPEGMDYDLTVDKNFGEIKPGDRYKSPAEQGTAVLRVKANYFGVELADQMKVEISNQTLFIVDDTVTIRQEQEFQVDYINFAKEVTWTMDSISKADSIITLEGDGVVTGNKYGYGKVYATNESGSRDSITVRVLLKTKDINSNILMYPNPNTSNWMNIQLENLEGKISYTVHGNTGKLITSGTQNTKVFRLDLPADMPSGTFLFTATDETGRVEQSWFIIVLE